MPEKGIKKGFHFFKWKPLKDKQSLALWAKTGMPFFLVRLKGFEPPTFWFVAKHSIQLSYSRIPPCLDDSLDIIPRIPINCKRVFLFFRFFFDGTPHLGRPIEKDYN